MHAYRDASKEISDVDFKSPDTKRRLLAKNEMQSKTLECKLSALKKEHRKSISKINGLILEVVDKLKKPCLNNDGLEETITIKGETPARRSKEDSSPHPPLLPALRPSKITDVRRTTACNSASGLYSNVDLQSKAIEKNMVKTTLGCSAAKPAQSSKSKKLQHMNQKYKPLQKGNAEYVEHVNARERMFNLPFISITAPYSKRRKSLRISKRRKSSSASTKSKGFEVVASPAENEPSLLAFNERPSEKDLQWKNDASPELKSLQSSVAELHVPSYHLEEREHVNKGGFRSSFHKRTKSEISGDLEVSSLADEDLSRPVDARKLCIDLWKLYSRESEVDEAS